MAMALEQDQEALQRPGRTGCHGPGKDAPSVGRRKPCVRPARARRFSLGMPKASEQAKPAPHSQRVSWTGRLDTMSESGRYET